MAATQSTATPQPPQKWPEPTADDRSGDGYVDEPATYIADAGAKVAAMPADGPLTAQLRGPFTVAARGVEGLRRRLWRNRDVVHLALTNNGAVLQQMGGAQLRSAQAALVKNVTDEAKDASQADAQTALVGLNGAADALSAALIDASAPAGLNDGLTLDDHVRDVTMENDLNARPKPVTDLLELLDNYEARPEKEDEARRLCRVGLRVAVAIRDASPAKIKQRTSNAMHAAPGVDEQRDMALRLINRIRRFQHDHRPAEIGLAQEALRDLDLAFSILAGMHGRFVSFGDLMRAPGLLDFLDSSKSDAARPWQLDPRWLGRFLPPDGPELPGWSPRAMRTSLGGLVREPRRA